MDSFWLSTEVRIAVRGGSDDPWEEGEDGDEDAPGGDDMASFGTIGVPMKLQ